MALSVLCVRVCVEVAGVNGDINRGVVTLKFHVV